MTDPSDIDRKLALAEQSTLLPLLEPETREFVRGLARRLGLSFQDIRRVAEVARDLEMWQEKPLSVHWRQIEEQVREESANPRRKKRLIDALDLRMRSLRRRAKEYPPAGLPRPRRPELEIVEQASAKKVFGDCPVASEKTVCCQLKTIDAVENCAYGCSYCTIQTFYGPEVAVDSRLKEKLAAIRIDPDRFYHFGTGQSSDSLLWGNRGGILDALCDFAGKNPGVLLEFKTKSAGVAYFLQRKPPSNVVCSWSLNTEAVIRSEEHFTAGLEERLSAARRVADRGVWVAFHFHPIVHYQGWADDYAALAARVQAMFRTEEVLFISFGSVTFIKPVLQRIRRRGEPTKILQMELVPDPHGKLSYPDDVKIRLFRHLHDVFRPWQDQVYMYLCMERDDIWHEVFGRSYASNDEFETDFGEKVMSKVRRGVPGRP